MDINLSSNSTITTTSNTAPDFLASQRQDFSELDELTSRLSRIAQRERQLLNDFTDSVDAILNQVSSQRRTAPVPIAMPILSAQQITCTVCLDKQRDCVLEPCMHVCCCISCLQNLTDSKCPICRTHIDFYLKLYIC